MTNNQNSKPFDLEERTLTFSNNCRSFIKKLNRSISNINDCTQLARSSGSIGANYIEANESLSKKDFVMRVKISRKEAKESIYWLKLVECDKSTEKAREELIAEATELKKILSSIIVKSSNNC